MKPWAGLVALQLALVGLYLGIEAGRSPPPPFRYEVLREPAPQLAPRRDGEGLAPPEGTYLLHFWATWCAPCRAELPTLLEAAEAEGLRLLALSDEPWPKIDHYFQGEVPPSVAIDPGAFDAWRVTDLPETWVVQDGRTVARIAGARDWSSQQARAFLRAVGTAEPLP